MPSSVPEGLRLELSRSRILPGQEEVFDQWMGTLNDRYEECEASLSAQRAVFEATFRHEEADGSVWIYHVSLVGTEGAGLDEGNDIDATHARYSRQVKEPGWEELAPKFMLAPDHLKSAMVDWARHGSTEQQASP